MKSKLREIEDRLEQDREIDAPTTPDKQLIKIGHMMRTLRKVRGLTQRQVQALSGVNQAEISRIEAGVGRRGMTISQMATLARKQHARVVMLLVDESVVEKSAPDKLKVELGGLAALAKVVL